MPTVEEARPKSEESALGCARDDGRETRGRLRGYATDSTIMAMPCPPPMQALAMP